MIVYYSAGDNSPLFLVAAAAILITPLFYDCFLKKGLENKALKNSNPRHTYSTLAGIEDALAIALDILNELKVTLEYLTARMMQLQDVLKTLRSGPNSYNQNRPSGRRPKRRIDL